MKLTKELFQRYIDAPADEKDFLVEELGFECEPDMDESFFIWALIHGDKNLVMSFYQMDEEEYTESHELWADEGAKA